MGVLRAACCSDRLSFLNLPTSSGYNGRCGISVRGRYSYNLGIIFISWNSANRAG
jgi:hypothetical protein